MIKADSLIYKLDMKLNKLSSLANQVIPIENKILALNEAQLKLIKVKLDANNPLGLGLDAFKKRYEDLENLVERASNHEETLILTDSFLNEWSADLSILDPEYMFYVDAYLTASKGSCKNKVLYINKGLVKHADVVTLLSNNNYRPSFEYEDTFSVVSGLQVSIYTDGTFVPDNIYISYIRYPQKIDYPGYINFDGSPSALVDCELNEYLEDELLNFAVQEIAMDTDNTPVVQATQLRQKESE